MNEMYVVAFNSTHYAIKFEKILLEAGLKIMMIPSPREIIASCGLSIRFDKADMDIVLDKLKNSEVEINGVFKLTKLPDIKEKQAEKII
ncbi:MAG: DUF3343 domain-containing protein [Peptoclostridium sp.]|uniref:DUF3343 domain-containing protein n=1 Tax=Peptoclostridium sp. TaxID=1904860 RepID=UPI00139AD917|nr:DUF3343 domain-containing protein [Peptoclostridium sp.]MZQ74763.1 DUF3343 domain-containing protein [Peptoclostridium sp.]